MIRAAAWNVRGLNCLGHQAAVGHLVRDYKLQFVGLLETRVRQGNIARIRANLLLNWAWFDDYSGPGGRIWLSWNPLELDVRVVKVEYQLMHCKIVNKVTHTSCLCRSFMGTVTIRRRDLWSGLCVLADDCADDPWCVLGDFNAIVDSSEACGRAVEFGASMAEFRDCISSTALLHLPFTGCPFTWHNCSEGSRSLWKRLDRVLVNETWVVLWPQASYVCALPGTSDHSPIILSGSDGRLEKGCFRFDNFLARQPGFLNSVSSIWRHSIFGTQMFSVVKKLKALKPIFRAQRKAKGDLTNNVSCAKAFLT
ncbi:UNVERIFIED_CONTAM: hypothetical protein Sradi_7183200 [Sesamum radiatum]|uniref:Endonuclease/exonuclease/phosphatase domain-containing protein n=1 Tax=Sesamum radiatum TaxID=300843 RepID=A0AAW2IU82_SESRA